MIRTWLTGLVPKGLAMGAMSKGGEEEMCSYGEKRRKEKW